MNLAPARWALGLSTFLIADVSLSLSLFRLSFTYRSPSGRTDSMFHSFYGRATTGFIISKSHRPTAFMIFTNGTCIERMIYIYKETVIILPVFRVVQDAKLVYTGISRPEVSVLEAKTTHEIFTGAFLF